MQIKVRSTNVTQDHVVLRRDVREHTRLIVYGPDSSCNVPDVLINGLHRKAISRQEYIRTGPLCVACECWLWLELKRVGRGERHWALERWAGLAGVSA